MVLNRGVASEFGQSDQLPAKMSLYRFFSRVETQKGEPKVLPDPRGLLSKIIPSSSISATNSEVEKCGQTAAGKKRNPIFPRTEG